MEITLDQQIVSQRCAECAVDFRVVRGSVYDHGQPIGLYLIALHGHTDEYSLAHLAIAILTPAPQAVAMHVISRPDDVGFAFVDWASSPWSGETYLGEMLDRDAARASPLRSTFFHIAEHVVDDLPDVREYLR